MNRKPHLLVTLGLTGAALLWPITAAAEPPPPAAQAPPAAKAPPAAEWIPADALIAIEVAQPKAVLDPLLGPNLAKAVKAFPAYRALTAQTGYQEFLGLVEHFETALDTDWRTGIRKLLGGGMSFAVLPDESILLVVDATDGELLTRLNDIVLGFARAEANQQGDPDRVASREYRGVTGWTLGPEEIHCIVGNRLLIANKPKALKAVLDLRDAPDGESLAKLPAYQAARKAAGKDAAPTLFVNLAVLEQHPPIGNALSAGPYPAASLLVPGMTEALRDANWAAAGLHVKNDTLTLRAVVDDKSAGPTGPAPYAWSAKSGHGTLPNVSVPHQIAGLSVYRDLEAFYAAKDDLFPQRTSGLIFFENMMGIFFTGRDLTEEVLSQTKPEIRFVVAEQQYDPAVGTPADKLPSFAAIFRIHHPDEFGEVMERAWGSALGMFNFTRGQNALPTLLVDLPTHGDVKYRVDRFAPPGEDDDKANLDSRFNFQPALARLGDFVVVSSTESLARDLIDALKKEIAQPVKALADAHSLVELDGRQLASILAANRDSLVRQNMIDDGNTREEAELQMDLLKTLAERFTKVKLTLGRENGLTAARLTLTMNLP